MRLADILLLKAEAYANLGDLGAGSCCCEYYPQTGKSSRSELIGNLITGYHADAVLNERRLELAFEGQRWFDLVRTGKVFDVLNTLNSRDPGRLAHGSCN